MTPVPSLEVAAAAVPPRRPRLRVIALGNLIVLVLVLIASEIVARGIVLAWGVPTRFEPRPFQGFGQTDPVVWWRLRPGLDAKMGGVRLRTNRLGFRDDRESFPPRTTRIYCLGDSSTFGWGVEADRMFTAIAERSLRGARGEEFAVISAGVPGYTSYQCLRQFQEQIAPLKPDWIVVMASNNECRSRNIGDRERGRMLARKRMLERWLGWSHLWLLLSRGPEALSRSWDLDPEPGRVADTVEEYGRNLRELVRKARAAGCGVILMGMPLHLRAEPIWKHFDKPVPEVASLLRRADRAREGGEPIEAQMGLLEDAARLQPDQFEAHWRLAKLESRRGREEEADRQFSMAREGDLHPDAAKPSYNRALEALCAEEDVPFLDLDRLFRESGSREDALFLDHCHPSSPGHALIGEALARRLAGLLPAPKKP